jgi:WD40 repeat protein
VIHIYNICSKVRTKLYGHGDDINCLSFHPRYPMILASGSADHTVRIWDLLGEPSVLPEEERNYNYPFGTETQGTQMVAILMGGGPSGHRDKVIGLVGASRVVRGLGITDESIGVPSSSCSYCDVRGRQRRQDLAAARYLGRAPKHARLPTCSHQLSSLLQRRRT